VKAREVEVSILKNWNRANEYDCEAVAKDYEAGMSLSEVMRKHGVRSWSSITRILNEMGVKRRSISEGLRRKRQLFAKVENGVVKQNGP